MKARKFFETLNEIFHENDISLMEEQMRYEAETKGVANPPSFEEWADAQPCPPD